MSTASSFRFRFRSPPIIQLLLIICYAVLLISSTNVVVVVHSFVTPKSFSGVRYNNDGYGYGGRCKRVPSSSSSSSPSSSPRKGQLAVSPSNEISAAHHHRHRHHESNESNKVVSKYDENHDANNSRRSFLSAGRISITTMLLFPPPAPASQPIDSIPFHSAAYGREEYTNSIVASRDTNISPKEVYDTIASDYLKEAYDAAMKDSSAKDYYKPRALDVGAGAGVSTEVLYNVGYHTIDALDWSAKAWDEYVVDDPNGHCPDSVTFYELDDERYLDQWRGKNNSNNERLLFDVIVFNFAVNEAKASLFARELLNKEHGRLLAPINTSNDYWLKQTYKVIDGRGEVLWSAADVGAWSVQFQPDVTQDTCSGVWCAPFNGFQKKQ